MYRYHHLRSLSLTLHSSFWLNLHYKLYGLIYPFNILCLLAFLQRCHQRISSKLMVFLIALYFQNILCKDSPQLQTQVNPSLPLLSVHNSPHCSRSKCFSNITCSTNLLLFLLLTSSACLNLFRDTQTTVLQTPIPTAPTVQSPSYPTDVME